MMPTSPIRSSTPNLTRFDTDDSKARKCSRERRARSMKGTQSGRTNSVTPMNTAALSCLAARNDNGAHVANRRADVVPPPPSGLTSLGALVGLSVVPARDAKPPEPSHLVGQQAE